MESILTLLINDLASTDTCEILVLDDYHAIDSPTIHSTLAFLLDHLATGRLRGKATGKASLPAKGREG